MSNYVEYNGKIAFHPGYYIKEIVDNSGLTQEDFAKRLDTTPKNLSVLIRGEQSLSVDMAMKFSRMLNTSIIYWLNLQNAYDALIAEFKSEKELENERKVFALFDYKYFKDNFGLSDLPRKIDEQIKEVRNFLDVSTLSVLCKKDMAVSFRSSATEMSEANIIKANIMVQIATNMALKRKAPQFNRKKFEESIRYALTLTKEHDRFYKLVYDAFFDSGVVFIILPNLPGSKINGATKKIGDNIMLMVNNRRLYSDTFWFTLFHEIGHIINNDFGISFDDECGEAEEFADEFARNSLIPLKEYEEFVDMKDFTVPAIKNFSSRIDRDPAIVLGRLQNDGFLDYNDWNTKSLRYKYNVKVKYSI